MKADQNCNDSQPDRFEHLTFPDPSAFKYPRLIHRANAQPFVWPRYFGLLRNRHAKNVKSRLCRFYSIRQLFPSIRRRCTMAAGRHWKPLQGGPVSDEGPGHGGSLLKWRYRLQRIARCHHHSSWSHGCTRKRRSGYTWISTGPQM